MTKGSVLSALKKLEKETDEYIVGAPTAVAGVRGTTFLVKIEGMGELTTAVYEGKVILQNKTNAGETISIEALQQVDLVENDFSKAEITPLSKESKEEIIFLKTATELTNSDLQELRAKVEKLIAALVGTSTGAMPSQKFDQKTEPVAEPQKKTASPTKAKW